MGKSPPQALPAPLLEPDTGYITSEQLPGVQLSLFRKHWNGTLPLHTLLPV
jgi:hypothetical protein